MLLEVHAVGPFFKNGFVLGCEDTRESVLIDPGDEAPALLAFADRQSLSIRHILLTHAHVDHVTGLGPAKAASGAPIWLQREDVFLYDDAVEQGRLFDLDVRQPPPVPDPRSGRSRPSGCRMRFPDRERGGRRTAIPIA